MIKMNKTIIILCAIFFLACCVNITATEEVKLPDSNRMKPDHLPTPYTAEQIRDFSKNRKIKFLMETPGKPKTYQVFEFREGDAEKSDMDGYMLNADGKLVGKKQTARANWTELQAHASYPEKNTSLSRDSKTTKGGTFDCWLYTTAAEKEGKKMITRAWFARSMPGPPVLLIQELDGKTVFKMTMVETGK